ncbi:MAG: DUF2062 domain-containing protein [Myxococcota bacterium]
MRGVWEWLKDLIVHRILGLDDTPHRIAWGVLLGTMVTFTPTLGFQIAVYVAIATLVRANKVSGIPILFISNPFTAVPLYYFVWRVGAVVVPGDSGSGRVVRERLRSLAGSEMSWSDVVTLDFWLEVGGTIVDMGVELWVGSFVLGVLAGIPVYFISYWGVMEYRRRTWHRHRLRRRG